jgi:succinoglycan biosynthesis protein ExoL
VRIAYFIHDLSDAAAAKRVEMLAAGGADLSLAGFRRTDAPIAHLGGVPATDLGQTFDGALKHRAQKVLDYAFRPGQFAQMVAGADVVLARNLEMLAIAASARKAHAPGARLVYECLDIHRAMISMGPVSAALRAVEQRLMRGSDLLIVSAPAFLAEYFERQYRRLPPRLLLENKLLRLAGDTDRPSDVRRQAGPPWRIGWFGILRCRESVDYLKEIVRLGEGRIEVVIRGKPSPHTIPDLPGLIADTPGVSFGGAYRLDELAQMYAGVHFMWSVDHADKDLNSKWLLPNRLYEGNYFNTPNIAERRTATGAWLADKGCGVVVDDPVRDVATLLKALTPEGYRELEDRSRAIPSSAVASDLAACRELVETLGGRAMNEGLAR